MTLVLLWGCILPVPVQAESQCSYTVSDVVSLLNAQNTIRGEISAGLSRNIVVCLNGGTYALTTPLQFNSRDSGTGQYSITYQNSLGQTPIISGGVTILASSTQIWNGDWQWTIPEVKNGSWWFRELYKNGQRLPRARWPNENETLLPIDITQSGFGITPDSNLSGKNAELVIYGSSWNMFRTIITSGNQNSPISVVDFGQQGSYEQRYPKTGNLAYLENSVSFIDSPGEWSLDPESGVLTYRPPLGENHDQQTFVAPKLFQLLIVKGTSSQPVKNLNFQGLSFQYTGWDFPKDIGFVEDQASHYITPGGGDLEKISEPAILFEYVQDSSFSSNNVSHLGANGLALGIGTQRNVIENTHFSDIGATPLFVGYRAQYQLQSDWPNPAEDAPVNNTIQNNFISDAGIVDFGAVGIWNAFATGTKISHNAISNLPYTGISSGFIWVSTPTSTHDTLIEYNDITGVMSQMSDGAGIYTLGSQPNSHITGNSINALGSVKYTSGPRASLYFDEGSQGFTVNDNIIPNGIHYNSDSAGESVYDSVNLLNCPSISAKLFPPVQYEDGKNVSLNWGGLNEKWFRDGYHIDYYIFPATSSNYKVYKYMEGLTENGGDPGKDVFITSESASCYDTINTPLGFTVGPILTSNSTPTPGNSDRGGKIYAFGINFSIPNLGNSGTFSVDLDDNKKVDITDYNILVSDFGKTGTPGFIPADINKDGIVDIFDYNILVGYFGKIP